MKRIHVLLILACLFLSSCARMQPYVPYDNQDIYGAGPFIRQDITHVVAPGETLWRIGKMYDVPVDSIIKANGLASAAKLAMGQRLMVPNAAPIKPVVALYRSSKWKYIIVHHSATDEGNAFSLFNLHKQRGFNGLGYHFIIDNGTDGKNDGQIEVSPRWVKQEDGAHCKAGSMNHKGIGICLVGNFSANDRVSSRQMASLIYLVNLLRKHYRIPEKNILGHRNVPGARTECPGKYFPWQEFISRL